MAVCFSNYYSSDHSPDSFQLHFPGTYVLYLVENIITLSNFYQYSRYPFHWRTPIGFTVAMIILLPAANALIEISIIILVLPFAFSQYAKSFIDDFKITYDDLDNCDNDEQITKKVYGTVQFYACVKR